MPHFDTLKVYSCGKHCEQRRNCLNQDARDEIKRVGDLVVKPAEMKMCKTYANK